jgi:hypothetical protein
MFINDVDDESIHRFLTMADGIKRLHYTPYTIENLSLFQNSLQDFRPKESEIIFSKKSSFFENGINNNNFSLFEDFVG